MSMFDGTEFEAELALIVQAVDDENRLEDLYVITPEEQAVIDAAENVRSRIIEVGLAQGQFDRASGKILENFRTNRLLRRYGRLPALAFRTASFDNIIVDAPKVVIPGFPSLVFGISIRDSEPDFWVENEGTPNTACRWFELGMFTSSTVEIHSVGIVTQKYRREFSMAGNERPRVHDLQHTSDFAVNDEGVSIPYYVSPERWAQARVVLNHTMTTLEGVRP